MESQNELIAVISAFCIVSFCLFFTIPFFARRYGKFMPADAGTALVRSFHIPRFAAPNDPTRKKIRRLLWAKLFCFAVLWGTFGLVCVLALLYLGYSLAFLVMLWICALLACIDEKIRLLPDVLTVPLMITGFLFAALNATELTPLASAGGALAGILLPTVASALMTPFRPRALGGGDFKMLSGIGSWIGFPLLAVTIFLSFLFFAVIALIRKNKVGPYGMPLLMAVITALILQACGLTASLFFVV